MNILLAEDSALLRNSLQQLLELLGHQVTAVSDARELLEHGLSAEENYDVILTDVRMPPGMSDDGLAVVHQIRTSYPDQPVVVMSQYVAASYLDTLLQHGAFGYVLKERVTDVDALVHTLKEVCSGGSVVDPEVVSALLQSRKNGISTLTPREKEVLGLMAQGLSNSEIEQALFLTSSAVSKHVANVFMKLGFVPEDANRRVKAVLLWLRHSVR